MTRTYYKVLSADGKSKNGGDLQWSLPTQKKDGTYKPGKWHKVTGAIEVCSNGIHLTTEPFNWYEKDCVCYVAEGRGDSESESDGNKAAFREARLLQPMPHPKWWIDAMAFVDAIKIVPFMKPDGNPLPEWKLFTASSWSAARSVARYAAEDAAWSAAWSAARSAAWSAAWSAAEDAAEDAAWSAARAVARSAAGAVARSVARSAVRDAARSAAEYAAEYAAWSAAGSAARAVARAAAEYAARSAARSAAEDAAEDAALYTYIIHICSDLELEQKHIDHAKARWQVWEKGYCLLGDIAGVLYVYAGNES